MDARKRKALTEKQREEAAEDQFVGNSLQLVTLVASTEDARPQRLHEWCVRSAGEVDRELSWAASEKLLATTSDGKLTTSSGPLELTRKGLSYAMAHWIGRHGGGSAAQMARKFKRAEQQIEAVLEEMVEKHWMAKTGELCFEAELYTGTQKGLALVGLKALRAGKVGALEEGHLRACVDRAILLEEEYGPQGKHGLHWEVWGEPQHGAANRGKAGPARLASPAYYVNREKLYKRPDLLLIRRFRDSAKLHIEAVEEELSNKGNDELHAIMLAYSECPSISVVRYYVARRVKNRVERAVASALGHSALEMHSAREEEPGVTEIRVIAVQDSCVPGLRRMPHYRPQKLPGSKELFERIASGPRWEHELRLDVLGSVACVARSGVITPDAVATWRGCDTGAADELLRIAHGGGWLYYSHILRAQGPMFFTTQRGREAVGLDTGAYEVDFKWSSHPMVAASLCINARVAAAMSLQFGERVRTRWELRADSRFSGGPMMTVGSPGEGLGDFRHPGLVIEPEPGSEKGPGVVLVMSERMQGSTVKQILTAWHQAPGVSEVHCVIGPAYMLKAANDVLGELEGGNTMVVRELPRR